MSTGKLELISITAIEELLLCKAMKESSTVKAVRKAIAAYSCGDWTKSAELFIKAWNYSRATLDRHYQQPLSSFAIPSHLGKELSLFEKAARTIHWLGIYALHDAAAAYFQAPDECKPKEMVAGGKAYNETCKDVAHCAAVLCMRYSRMTEISKDNELSISLQQLNVKRINSNLPLIILSTIRSKSWMRADGCIRRTLRRARESSGEDEEWKKLLENVENKYSRDPLSLGLLEYVYE
ncbi:hypothetical protein V500_01160 [Pseudogymnoascus sp. VKM F-4518 (FW-2643)]|nr:hypothetical protein V500_01160 [Pseudogymnoascus sp. VKM F-4518 (FW-2643)]